jgi:hypothetical protein
MTNDRESRGGSKDHPALKAKTGGDTRRARDPILRLQAFANIQRHLARIDFTALTSIQRTIAQATASKIPEILAAQNAAAKHFAQTIDFSRLGATHAALLSAGGADSAANLQTQWAASLAKSVDFSALKQAIAPFVSLTALPDTNRALADVLKQADLFTNIAKNIRFELPRIAIPNWVEALNRWIPVNLRDITDLDPVAAVALNEGIPLSWVPRSEIVIALVSASSREERQEILVARRDEILDDCETALTDNDNEWATQCRNAILALRAGFDAPAQSHAGNIIDSIVLALHGAKGRQEAKKSAKTEFDDLPLQLAAENLTLRPLLRAFTSWRPASGDALPDHFARHATAHAVGNVGVFAPFPALVAVMLATSLTVQYSLGEVATHEHVLSAALQAAAVGLPGQS